ncbi:MAG: UDP-N-acetylmuramate dehydrogenase [Cellvibrionaceae bacterium]|nr:UDP-N-acetylmuramate dehydrogenase [Cellvibrionaceae bacterium]
MDSDLRCAGLLCEAVDLQPLNTLAVPAVARWYSQCRTQQQLLALLDVCREQDCPLLVLGGGSNILLPEAFEGLVLHNALKGRAVEAETATSVTVSLAAGEQWHDSVCWAVANHWYGIENLALIPGTVGAAPIQNIGAYGVELMDCFDYLEAVERASGNTLRLSRADCQFAYRESIFKRELKDKLVITRVVLRLQKQPCLQLDYPSLRQALAAQQLTQPSLADVAATVIAIRQSKLPDPAVIPNAGSFFKNPQVSVARYRALKQQFPALVAYAHGQGHYKLAAAWLIEQAGWRGVINKGIGMHQAQALVLTNPGRQSSQQLLAFAADVQASVYQLFGVTLDIEPLVVNSP